MEASRRRRLRAEPWKEARWISRSLHSHAVRDHITSFMAATQERVPSSGAVSTRISTSFGFKKLFRALQAFSGNANAMTEIARDLGAGLLAGVAVNPDMLTTATENMVSVFAKLESMKAEREGPGFPRRPPGKKRPASSSGVDHRRRHQQQTGGYNDPFLKMANEMFVAYTNSKPYWSGGMPMSVEGSDAQSYYGREAVPPSMVMSMEEYKPQPYRGEKGVQPSMAEAMFRQPDDGSNGYYLSPEEGWAASMRGSYAGGADARSFSYGGDYHHHGLTPYTTPYNNYNTTNNGPMVCGFCLKPISAGSLDSACRCYHTQQHTGNMHFQPPPPLPSEHAMENPKTPSPSTTAITDATPGGLDQRAVGPSKETTKEVQCACCQRAVGMGYKACGCDACLECVKPSPASEYHPAPFTCPGQHGLTSWVILARWYTCHLCGGMIASGVPVLSCSICQVYACPSCVWIHHSTSS